MLLSCTVFWRRPPDRMKMFISCRQRAGTQECRYSRYYTRYRQQQTCDNGRRGGEREGTTGTRVHTAYTIKQFFKQSLFIIYTLLWKIFANHLLWCPDILWGWRISFGSESCNWLELINKIVRTRRVFRVLLCHAWTFGSSILRGFCFRKSRRSW